MPEHLLKALMDDDQGLASNLIRKAGGSPERVNDAINASLGKLPKVTGGDGPTIRLRGIAVLGSVNVTPPKQP